MKKKRNLSYFLVIAFVLVTAVLLFKPIAALTFGSVTTASSPPEGGTVTVTELFPPFGQQVGIQAFPAEGYVFDQWEDSLGQILNSLENPTSFTVIGDHTVTAHFNPCYTLSLSVESDPPGDGGTISVPVDANCPAGQFEAGTTFPITASANDGYQFDNWNGDPTETNPQLQITMDQELSVTAYFSAACQTLTLKRNNTAGGTIPTADPQKISCPNDHDFVFDESTTLTAVPETGWKVTGWTIGGFNLPPTGNTHLLTMPVLPAGQGLEAQVNYGEKATFGFAALTQGVAENAGTVQVEVIRDPSTLPNAGTIQYTTVELPGEATEVDDFIPKSGSLSFEYGMDSRTIVIDIEDDDFTEGQESFEIRLSESDPNIKLGVSTIEVQIDDDEGEPTIRFKPSAYAADESSTSVTVTVTVFPLPASGDVYVDLDTQDGTATAGEDYTAISERPLRIRTSRGQTSTTTNISLTPDDLDELDEETIILQLVNPSNNAVIAADSDAVLKILDDDLPPLVAFSQSEYYIKKAGNTQALIPVNLSAPSGRKVKVDYIVTHEQSGNVQEGTLSFAAGSQMETLLIPITSANPEDVFTMQLSDPQNVDLGTPNAASLFVLSTDTSDCHDLTLTFNGHGLAPAAISKSSSIGCPSGQYVDGELIDIVAQPKHGWYVSAWHGTIDDQSTSMQNVVKMPNKAFTVNVDYRVPIFFSIVSFEQPSFAGPNEEEPNSLFSQANGPLVFERDYRGNFSSASDAHDFFYFELDLETSVTTTLDDIPNSRDYDLALYDEDWIKGPIATSQMYDNDPEKITRTLQSGKYYIQVYSGASEPSTASYRLRVGVN